MSSELVKIFETQKYILEELENLRYGDLEQVSLGERAATRLVQIWGSWKFLAIQSTLLVVWIVLNGIALINGWDPYPFILLNLMLSFQAACASPVILMAQNLADNRDRRRSVDAYRSIANIEKTLVELQKHIEVAKNGSSDSQTGKS